MFAFQRRPFRFLMMAVNTTNFMARQSTQTSTTYEHTEKIREGYFTPGNSSSEKHSTSKVSLYERATINIDKPLFIKLLHLHWQEACYLKRSSYRPEP
ncbi:hypothetical protein NPIL_222241 [Nephila pilipes]|uniref:Uncharacterized protein n=1 Tax=Nephila pilipes TaxID=299642 RepID=A0A8X6T2Q3_NEPPI|nr:hypothetical protein NPIL_222241 [Nephila pilipes]